MEIKKKGINMELEKKDIIFWQCIVKVTQIPDMTKRESNDISWFGDLLNDKRVYGTKFSFGRKDFSWKFYMNAVSEKSAIRAGVSLLSYLKELYIGLDGTIRAKPICTVHLLKDRPDLYEISLPHPPYLNNQIPLIQKIVNLANTITKHDINVYIFWQFIDYKSGSVPRDITKRIWKYESYYNLRIIIEIKPTFDHNSMEMRKSGELMGYLDYLTTRIHNKEEIAECRKADIPAKNLLIMANLFRDPISKNLICDPICLETSVLDKDTNIFSKKIRTFDFSIPSNMDLDKAIDVQNENLGVPVKEPKILLGHLYRQGVLTEKKMYLNLHDLLQHVFISGLTGVGKSRFIAHLTNQIKNKDKSVGLLVINLVKKGEEGLYNSDIILKKGDPKFRVPYFIPDIDIEVICKQVARYLVSSLGLKNVVVSITNNVLYNDCIKEGLPSKYPKDVFKKVLDWLEENPYHPKFNTNITRAIENRVISLLSTPTIEKILELGDVPEWFIELTKGKTVFIDLSNFPEDEKRLITHAIFQMMRTLLPERRNDDDELKFVIVLDEAHEISEKPKNQSYDDDETVTRHYLEIVFEKILRAFRSRGISLMIADHLPRNLFEGVYKLPSIKVIFRSDKDFLQFITNNVEEQDSLANQKTRRALILDGVNARKFAIRNINYSYKKHITELNSSFEKLCPKCNKLLEANSKFCKKCGAIVY